VLEMRDVDKELELKDIKEKHRTKLLEASKLILSLILYLFCTIYSSLSLPLTIGRTLQLTLLFPIYFYSSNPTILVPLGGFISLKLFVPLILDLILGLKMIFFNVN